MNSGREDFCQWGKKKRPLLSTPKKKYNPPGEQENMKMLTLNDFAEDLKDFVLRVYCFQQFQSQMLILWQILLSNRLMKFLRIFAACTIGLVNQLMVRNFLKIYLSACQKKKCQKLNYWQEEKELSHPQKLILFWPKWIQDFETHGGCVNMWSLCQKISENY